MFLICCFNDSLMWNCRDKNREDFKLTHLLIIKLVHYNVYLCFVIVVGRFMVLALSTISSQQKYQDLEPTVKSTNCVQKPCITLRTL